jgi:lambda repressor-like predicted transcriptional regulator
MLIDKIEERLKKKGLNWSKFGLLAGVHPQTIKRLISQRIMRINKLLEHVGLELDIKAIKKQA